MTRFKITVSYDGTDYAGWQIQPNGLTIQEQLEKAVGKIAGEKVKIHGSGRTDHGVHARKQVAHFDLQSKFRVQGLVKAMNALLPGDIRVMKAEIAVSTFHARRSAISKEYRYFIWNSEIMPPFLLRYRTHIRKKMDVHAMREAASQLVGRHDFTSFTANPNQKVNGKTRNLSRLDVIKRGSEITFVAVSNGFLYKMVRSLAGFLIRVGEGALPPAKTAATLHAKLRTAAVPTAPAKGLFLWRVDY